MARRDIFSIQELRAVTDAFYKSEKDRSSDWIKYALSTDDGRDAYDKYFENLTDRTQDYFEEMADVAVGDCRDLYERIEDENLTDAERDRINTEINGWIEAAFDEFLA